MNAERRIGVWYCVCGMAWHVGDERDEPDPVWSHYRFRCADGREPEADHNPMLAVFRPDRYLSRTDDVLIRAAQALEEAIS